MTTTQSIQDGRNFAQKPRATPNDDSYTRVEVINRSPHKSHAVYLPFFLVHELVVFEGISFTQDEMRVYAVAVGQDDSAPRSALPIGRVTPVLLRVVLHGFVFELKLRAKLASRNRRSSEHTMTFTFHDLSPAHREALRKIIRSYHAGLVASPAELLEEADEPTFGAASATTAAPQTVADRQRRLWRNGISLGASALVILASVLYVASSLYDHFVYLPAQYATVTAPRIDLRAPEMGQLKSRVDKVGEQVARDAPLFTISADALDAELIETAARIEALADDPASTPAVMDTLPLQTGGTFFPAQQITSLSGQNSATILSDLTGAAYMPDTQANDMGNDADGSTGALTGAVPDTAATTTTDSAETRSDKAALSLLEGRQRALDLRKASLSAFAPCDCSVRWFQEDGAWVVPGDVVMTLARTSPAVLRIEALVKVSDATKMSAGQSAVITPKNGGKPFEARIERVTLDPESQPRVGFPDRLRKEDTLASVLLTTDQPLSDADIGQPFDVVMRRPTFFDPLRPGTTP
jgi:hypothetical protein